MVRIALCLDQFGTLTIYSKCLVQGSWDLIFSWVPEQVGDSVEIWYC